MFSAPLPLLNYKGNPFSGGVKCCVEKVLRIMTKLPRYSARQDKVGYYGSLIEVIGSWLIHDLE